MLTALDHVALFVRDLRTAADAYTSLLGCEPIWRDADGKERARFQLDNTALELMASGGAEGIRSLGFATPDIAKARHVLERRGIATDESSSSGAVLSADATYGATLELVERKPDLATSKWAVSKSKVVANDVSRVTSLDHIVITTSHPERAAALYGARLGLELKLDRTNPAWGSRLMFFKCGDLIVEVAHNLKNTEATTSDKAWGLSWRVADIAAAHARLEQSGQSVSEIRTGRKPGTRVFTVRDAAAGVPTLFIGRVSAR